MYRRLFIHSRGDELLFWSVMFDNPLGPLCPVYRISGRPDDPDLSSCPKGVRYTKHVNYIEIKTFVLEPRFKSGTKKGHVVS